MEWLRELAKILRRAGIRAAVTPIYGTRGPAVCLVLEGVSWEEVRRALTLTPDPSPMNGRGESTLTTEEAG